MADATVPRGGDLLVYVSGLLVRTFDDVRLLLMYIGFEHLNKQLLYCYGIGNL